MVFRTHRSETIYNFPAQTRRALIYDSTHECYLGSQEYLFESVLVLIIKNESHYLEEWIEYHRILGVDHFIIFDNGSTDDLQSLLSYYVDLGIVTLIEWPNLIQATSQQRRSSWLEQDTAYACAIRLLSGKAKWVGFLDVDEFVVFENPENRDICQFLDQCGEPMLNLFWRLFGTSGIERRTGGLVLEKFIYRATDEERRLCKVFVRPEFTHQIFNTHRLTIGAERFNGFTTVGTKTFASEDLSASYGGATIHHYHTRSREEYQDKVRRGWPANDDSKNINWEMHFRNHDTNEVLDTSATALVPEIKLRIQRTRDARALKSPLGQTAPNWLLDLRSTLIHYIDVFVEDGHVVLEGYFLDLLAPNEAQELEIHDGYGTTFGTVICNVQSQILLMNRVSHAAHGFRFNLAERCEVGAVFISGKSFVRIVKLPTGPPDL